MKKFTPNFITKVVTTLAILPIFAAPAPANAADMCMQIPGGQACANFYSDHDHIVADIGGFGVENMKITCRDGRFTTESHGDWSRSLVREFASSYCSEAGWNTHN